MRRPGSQGAVAAFELPPHCPRGVSEAKRAFDDVADRWARARGALADAQQALVKARADDVRLVVEAACRGEEPEHPRLNTLRVEEEIRDLEARVRALDVAVHERGDALAEAIDASRNTWLKALRRADTDSSAALAAALAQTRAALATLRPCRGARKWLEEFSLSDAKTGAQAQYAGGRLMIDRNTIGGLRGTFSPMELVDALDDLSDPALPDPGTAERREFERQRERAKEAVGA